MRELTIINYIKSIVQNNSKDIKIGIGDDCAVLEYNKDNYLLCSTDMIIENTHFVINKASDYKKIGHKAVAVNVSDIVAMGGVAKYITISIGLPNNIEQKKIKQLYSGILDTCKKYNVNIIGGDTNKSKDLVISISILGIVNKKKLVLRSTAKKGDFIFITGPIRNGKNEHLTFSPRIEESEFLVNKYKVNSMIDVSDGIALDLNRICYASNVGCNLYKTFLPLSTGLKFDDALYYGESFELLFTMNSKEANKLLKSDTKFHFFVIGDIIEKNKGINIIDKNGIKSKLKKKGF